MIEVEQVERFNAETGLSLEAGEFRRSVVTRGVSLNGLVDVEFSAGLRACIVRGGLLRAGDAIDTTGAA